MKNCFCLPAGYVWRLKISSTNNGGYSFFLGTVRDDLNKSGEKINGIFLECYKDSAIKQSLEISRGFVFNEMSHQNAAKFSICNKKTCACF